MHDPVRTTVDIPEPLLRQARVRAALDGKKMKDVVNEALVRYPSAFLSFDRPIRVRRTFRRRS